MNKKTIYKYVYYAILGFTVVYTTTAWSVPSPLTHDITDNIPTISEENTDKYEKICDVAHYKEADWSQVIGIAKNTTLENAKKIADENPAITFFFYTKGGRMVLEKEDGTYRVFNHGDAVFFSGEPWWGSAPGLADGYVKQ